VRVEKRIDAEGRIELQVTGVGVRTRRLDAGCYAREIEIDSI